MPNMFKKNFLDNTKIVITIIKVFSCIFLLKCSSFALGIKVLILECGLCVVGVRICSQLIVLALLIEYTIPLMYNITCVTQIHACRLFHCF